MLCIMRILTVVVIFFDHWYYENGLPLELISDRDKLFILQFWKALHRLSGVKLKMSTAYHPKTDGSSEQSNKTINQSICYHVRRNKKGWVCVLPHICFNIMNTVNAYTDYTPFQLRFGRSLRIIPPIIPVSLADLAPSLTDAAAAQHVISQLKTDVNDAKDNLLEAKVSQAYYVNERRGTEEIYVIGDKVMLSTLHRRQEYKKKGEHRVAKFFPRYDGPYVIIDAHPATSSYTLELLNSLNIFPTFHASELKHFFENDATLFPSQESLKPGPILTSDGLEEFQVQEIIDSHWQGRGYQFLVQWTGYGPNHN